MGVIIEDPLIENRISKDSEESLTSTLKRKIFEINKNNMTTINESDEKMINESCEFSETSIQENPGYLNYKNSLRSEKDKTSSLSSTNKTIVPIQMPFEKAKGHQKRSSNDEIALESGDNTFIEFEGGNGDVDNNKNQSIMKKNIERDLTTNFLNK